MTRNIPKVILYTRTLLKHILLKVKNYCKQEIFSLEQEFWGARLNIAFRETRENQPVWSYLPPLVLIPLGGNLGKGIQLRQDPRAWQELSSLQNMIEEKQSSWGRSLTKANSLNSLQFQFQQVLLTEKRGKAEIKQKHVSEVPELQFREYRFEQQTKLCPPEKQKPRVLKDKRKCLCVCCLERILIGIGDRKLILADYNLLLRLSLSKISHYSPLQMFGLSPWNICNLAQL